MKKILDEYRFVKLTRKAIYHVDKEQGVELQLRGFRGAHVATLNVKLNYLKRHPFTNVTKVNWICADAIKDEYLYADTITVEGREIDRLCITDKGRDLLDRAFFIMPLGLWNAWWDKYGRFIAGIGVGVIGSGIAYVANLLLAFYNNR